jgi:hypothetical protein
MRNHSWRIVRAQKLLLGMAGAPLLRGFYDDIQADFRHFTQLLLRWSLTPYCIQGEDSAWQTG